MNKFKISVLLACAGWLFCAPAARAQDAPAEYQVKAEMIQKFMQFVEWPQSAFADPSAPLVVVIVGPDPFQGFLDRILNGKSIGSRRYVVRHVSADESIGACHVLFVPAMQRASLPRLIRQLDDRPVLTIGECDEFLPDGGVLRFYMDSGKVRFEINRSAAEHSQLTISSKLMKLARVYDADQH